MSSKNKMKLFGIPNCDTVKKARLALDKMKIEYDFVDFKKQAPTESDINRWMKFLKAWPVNSKGPTYRKIREQFEAANDSEKMKILIQNSSAIKRPILEQDSKVLAIGLDLNFYRF